jgi:hypothetical protein
MQESEEVSERYYSVHHLYVSFLLAFTSWAKRAGELVVVSLRDLKAFKIMKELRL